MGAICGAIIGLTVVLGNYLSDIRDELKRLNDNLDDKK